jgi:hypothetical protein
MEGLASTVHLTGADHNDSLRKASALASVIVCDLKGQGDPESIVVAPDATYFQNVLNNPAIVIIDASV